MRANVCYEQKADVRPAESVVEKFLRGITKADFDVNRPLDADDNLNQIFTWHKPRKVSKALTIRYEE